MNPDLVVNAAAYTKVDKAEEEIDAAYFVNAIGAKNIAIASGQYNIPIIHISTDYVFLGNSASSYEEDDEVAPLSVYGKSKLNGEILVEKNNPRHIILRTSWVFSPKGENFLKTMLRLAETNDQINVVADQYGNPTSAIEIAHSILEIAIQIQSNPSFNQFGFFHYCSPEKMSWAEFARRIFTLSKYMEGNYAEVVDIPSSKYPTKAKRPQNSSLNCSKIKRKFGIEHSSIDLAIKEVIKQLR